MSRSLVFRPRASVCLVLVALGLISAPVALAHRKVSGGVATAMRSAVLKELTRKSCTGGDTLHFGATYLSTANPKYGFVSVTDNSCTYAFGYFVKRSTPSSDSWRFVTSQADSAQACSYFRSVLPTAVIADFQLKGTINGNFGLCVVSSTLPAVATNLGSPRKGNPAVRPSQIVYAGNGWGFYAGAGTASKSPHAGSLHWSTWTHTQATASGDVWVHDCSPDCATGTYTPYPVTLKLSRPGRLDGYYVFTKVTAVYTGELPPKQRSRTTTMSITYKADGGFAF